MNPDEQSLRSENPSLLLLHLQGVRTENESALSGAEATLRAATPQGKGSRKRIAWPSGSLILLTLLGFLACREKYR